jgi:uridylate kinase
MIDSLNKKLEIGTKISIVLGGGKLVDGTIKEKNIMSEGDIGFLIELENGLCRIKHKHLDIYHIYK